MDTFFWVLYGLLILLDLYVLFLLGSIWALSFGFYEGSFFWILYRLFLLDSIWALSFGFYMDLFFWVLDRLFHLGSIWSLSLGSFFQVLYWLFLLGSICGLFVLDSL